MSQKKYKILICSTSVANYDRRMQRIAKSLHNDGYEVHWISRFEGDNKNDFFQHIKLNPFIKSGFLFYAFFNIRLFFKLLFKSFDLVYSVDLDTVLPCYLASRIRNKKIIFDAHEYFTEVPELIGRAGVKKFWQSIANFCLPKIKHNITVGSKLSQIFAERYKSEYSVVRNISQEVKMTFGLHSKKDTLVYLGAVNKGRGVELAIEALRGLTEKKLKVIGGGDLLLEMKELSLKLDVADRVEFLGYVKPEEIQEHMQGCYLALNLLLAESESYYYSLANKFFDYLHFGIPALNMAYPEYEMIHEKYGLGPLIDNYTLEDLVSAIQKMEVPEHYEERLKGLEQAKMDFKWENEEKKLLELVKKVA